MPVAPTYPGVYIEEIPSGVHTITGVSTSLTAFIGYTARGRVNEPVHIFSFADFERAFGGVSVDSPLSYCVKHFFQNGGSEAYVVRVAQGATSASVTLENSTGGGAQAVLVVTAGSAGTWGNNLQLDVDYDTLNPSSLFNLRITEFIEQNGQMVPGPTEVYRNLTLNSADPGSVIDVVNAASQLVTLAVAGGLNVTGSGTSTSGTLTAADIALLDANTHSHVGVVVNGQGPFDIKVTVPPTGGTLALQIQSLTNDIVQGVNNLAGAGTVSVSPTGTTIGVTANPPGGTGVGVIHMINASQNDAAAILKLGLANGGTEVDGAASFRPAQTGTTGVANLSGLPNDGSIQIRVLRGASTTPLKSITLPIWGSGTQVGVPANLDDAAADIDAALAPAAVSEPFLRGARARRIGATIRVLPGWADPNISFDITSGVAANLGFGAATARNLARYAPGLGLTALAQIQGTVGNNGTPPLATDLIGNQASKTGIYALENVDIFNLLVMPDATAGQGMSAVLTEAIAYCTFRRAFMIIDAPDQIATFAQAQAWINGSDAGALRSRNSALYFPRLREPDPLRGNVVQSFPAAGALAGLYARTDGERGVWKAPAGTAATLVGATGLSYTLTNGENGTLNPLALNCLRTFPVYGTVSWGSRTGRGADALADEYKYVPVRRLALFLEESLYRGTQWAVFEPNDEPLWAQIRLNVGAFMHTLFSQGAFQGRTPRDAYFVKCDKETTTQNDIDLGRVNIVVGFAPLKPAEFVIIQIQQIAGAIQT